MRQRFIKEEMMNKAQKVLISVAKSVALIALQGFVFMKLWSWFIMTSFDGVPEVGIIPAFGIMMLLGFVTGNNTPNDVVVRKIDEDEDVYMARQAELLKKQLEQAKLTVTNTITSSIITLGFGWVLSWFV
ncbi:hypothetical protein HN958_00600 [Candidatus Falkowbacteria bacterium]|nr:hypothetical protein [Candidatus Falkowbacteria bacterium]MBT7006989.1 hypothetical protein [Candidatus Falkowbacteria bacterium]